MKSYIFAKFATRFHEVSMVAFLDEETNCENRFDIIERDTNENKVIGVDSYKYADDARRAFIYKSLFYWL